MTKRARSAARKAKHVESTFGITDQEYKDIFEYQGGKCAICQRVLSLSRKRPPVDHDHACPEDHPSDKGCRLCVRGILCATCNFKVLGHLRDDKAALQRGIDYLDNPPARAVLSRKVLSHA